MKGIKLKKLNLTLKPKPTVLSTASTFNELKALPYLTEKISIIIKQIKTHDTEHHFFKEVPFKDYKLLIEYPIHFGDVLNKINKQTYKTFGQIIDDINLLFSNCWRFNGLPTPCNAMFAFSNFAEELQWGLNQYIEAYKNELISKNYLVLNENINVKNHSTLTWEIPIKPDIISHVGLFEQVRAFPKLTRNVSNIINEIKSHDPQLHFFYEVCIVGYNEKIDNPIHFGEILERIENRQYMNMGEIKNDINLVWSNCYEFNGKPCKGNEFSNFAQDLENISNEHMDKFEIMLKACGYIKQCGKKRNRDVNIDKMTDCLYTSMEPIKKQKLFA